MIKRRGGNQIQNLIPYHKPLESKGQMSFNWGVLYTFGKIFLNDIRYFLAFSKQIGFKKYMSVQNFGTIKVSTLG
jgi:hypothetical protein